nr:hypothetical protein [uncultured Arsenicibacter sp.]
MTDIPFSPPGRLRTGLTKLVLFIASVFLLYCQTIPQEQQDDLSIASGDYVVLTQKALSYQADFDMQAWAGMLADDVVFIPPEGGPACQQKAAVLASWSRWRQKKRISVLRLTQLTHLPVLSRDQLPLTGKAGVYVISYCLADLQFTDGRTCRLSLHICCHFDPQKRIDYYSLYFPAEVSDQTSVLSKAPELLK